MACYYVTLYMTDRAYGGAEEGGWWYDCGYPVMDSLNRCFQSEDEAYDYRDSDDVQAILSQLNEGRPDLNSVNCEGIYKVFIDDHFPAEYPTERPYYC